MMTAIILAGGKSQRMGFDKRLLKLKNKFLLDEISQKLKNIFAEILIVTKDIIPNLGPLGGIYSGLTHSSSFYNFVVACDMPFINLSLIKYMCRNTGSYDVVVPKINHRYEPLFALYSKNCLPYIKELLDRQILQISRLFSKIKVRQISKKEVLRFANPAKIFANINTPEDLQKFTHG